MITKKYILTSVLITLCFGIVYSINKPLIHDVIINENDIVLDENVVNEDIIIKDLEIIAGKNNISIDFVTDVIKYTVALQESNVEKIDLNIKLQNNSSSSKIKEMLHKSFVLQYGDNTISLKIKKKDASVQNYIINIIRPSNTISDAKLSHLMINNKKVKLSDATDYLVVLNSEIEKTDIDARTNNVNVKTKFDNIDLSYGINKLTIQLINDDNVLKNYDIFIKRLGSNQEYKKIENIVINDVPFDFDSSKYNYNIEVNDINKDYEVTVYPKETISKMYVTEDNDKKSKIINVQILDDCETKSYTFNLIQQSNEIINNEHTNTEKQIVEKDNKNVIYYTFFGIGVVVLLISIIYAIKIKKRKIK